MGIPLSRGGGKRGRPSARAALFALLGGWAMAAVAEDFSDNAIGWRYGTRFREPFNSQDIAKNIVSYTHADSRGYGGNFLNIDVLKSDSRDPATAGSTAGALEAYVVYRHTFDLGKLGGRDLAAGPARSFGLTAGFDFNQKHDADYNSKKRMLVLGPTVMLDVPGFFNVSVLQLWESNNPSVSPGAFNPGYPGHRYYYRPHPMLNAVWAVPVGSSPLSLEGYANFIAAKGRDETGHGTAPETNIDMQLMYDLDAPRKSFRAGLEYQYWHNKFGNSDATVAPYGGNTARTPMVRAEYHF